MSFIPYHGLGGRPWSHRVAAGRCKHVFRKLVVMSRLVLGIMALVAYVAALPSGLHRAPTSSLHLRAAVLRPAACRSSTAQCTFPSREEELSQDVSGSREEELNEFMIQAGFAGRPESITEMSSGFCNWVYRVDYPAPVGTVVAKLFSPLAKLRLAPALRGFCDELAGKEALGPRLLHRSTKGLVCDFMSGETLTEQQIHEGSATLPKQIAMRLAALHCVDFEAATASAEPSLPPLHTGVQGDREPVVWEFLTRMLDHIGREGGDGVTRDIVDLAQVPPACWGFGLRRGTSELTQEPATQAPSGRLLQGYTFAQSGTHLGIPYRSPSPTYQCFVL